MTNRAIVVISSLCILLSVLSEGIATEVPLRTTLEKTWRNYLEACKSGKEAELEKTMSSFRLGTMKNNLASASRSLTPDLIKSIAEYATDISKAEFVKLLEKGPTAGLVYVEDSEDKDATGKPRVKFIFKKFVKEESGWKVDEEMDIGGPKFQADGEKSEFDPSDLPSTHAIDGQIRSAPKLIAVPDVAAFLDIMSYGYTTRITVNGTEQNAVSGGSSSGLIIGGLKKGKNSIVIVITKTEKEPAVKPTVKIRRLLENETFAEVFKFEPKENIEGKHTFNFTIENQG